MAKIGRLCGPIIKEVIEQDITIGEEQNGFTRRHWCIDNTFSFKQILGKKRKFRNLDTHLIFIELDKALEISTNITYPLSCKSVKIKHKSTKFRFRL